MQWWTGKGYGISSVTDINGRPLLTFQGPNDKRPFLLSDRVAQTFDFTIQQNLIPGAMKNDRMDGSTSSFIKSQLGGGPDDELDHKISLELGGSNTPSNLMIQPGMTSGASAASDTLENNLALDVVNGKISLLTAWRTLAEQKGFLLGEDSKIGTNFSLSEIATQIFNIGKNAVAGIKAQELTAQGKALQAQMKDDVEKLKQNPNDQVLMTKMFGDNVQNLQNTTGISQADAQGATKSFLAHYAESKGIDPREVMGALNANIQKIVDNSVRDPNIFGIPSTAIVKIIGALQAVSSIAVTGGILLAIIGIFLAGPEAIVGALSGGLLESIGAIFGVSALTGIGLTSFAFGEALNVASIGLNMSIKSMYDNGYLLPTQNISALKDALAVQKGLSGFLPSQVSEPATTSQPQYSPVGGEGTIDGNWIFKGGRWVALTAPAIGAAPVPTLFVGHITNGALSPVTQFTPKTRTSIGSLTELETAAQENIAGYLSGIAGLLKYRISLKNSVIGTDGSVMVGSVVHVPTTKSKKGVQHYKNVQNKFAVVEIFAARNTGGDVHIGEIVLGAVDETRVKPTPQDLATISNEFTAKSISSSMAGVSSVAIAPNTVTLPNGQIVQINAKGDIISPVSTGPAGGTSGTTKAVTPAKPAESAVSPTFPTPVEAPNQPNVKTPAELAALEAQQILRTQSLNAWETIAISKQTQINYRLPDGTVVRAGINPAAAPTLGFDGIMTGKAAFYIPREIANEAVRQYHMMNQFLEHGFFNQDAGV